MKKAPDTPSLENIAKDIITFELQKPDLLVVEPEYNRLATDSLFCAEIADNVNF